MEVPVIIAGTRAGTLSIRQEGLYTLYEARTGGNPGGLVRLWLHGEGESAYLGLLQPVENGLRLCRRLTALEQKRFPRNILCATDTESYHNAKEKNKESLENREKTGSHKMTDAKTCPWPAPVSGKAGELLWLRDSSGVLRSHDGVSELVALPAKLKSAPKTAVLRRIGDTDYLIFRR